MGRAWARNLISACDRVTLIGWVDVVPGRAEEAIQDVGVTGVSSFTDFETALSETKPDFVVDVTVPEAHEIVTLTALGLGIPVLGEKPMSTSLLSAKRMVLGANQSAKLYMVSQSRRYDAGLIAFRNAIASLGGGAMLNADFFIGAHFDGFRNTMDDVLLTDMAIHTFDAARYLIGSIPTSVYCDSFRLPWSWYQGDETALATFNFESGVRFSYRGSWAAEGHATQWESTWRAVCPKGTVIWDGASQILVDHVTNSSGFVRDTTLEVFPITPILHSGIAGSLQDFLNALEGGSLPMGVCTDNIWSLAMVLYAVESSRLGQKVDIAI